MNPLKKIGFLCAFILPTLLVIGFYLGDWWNFLTVGFAFIVIPLLDLIVGLDPQNVEEASVSEVSEAFYYRFVTYIWTFVQVGVVIWGAYTFATAHWNGWIAYGFLLSMATVTGGIGITVAHELGHRQSRLEQFYAQMILMTVCYMHFFIEHNRGHHVHVATPRDPATSRKGENFYVFWLRTVWGSYRSAWEIEVNHLKKSNLPLWSSQNMMLWYNFLPILFCTMLTLGWSIYAKQMLWGIPIFFVVQSILAFTLLELVNYIEHYGIVRKVIGQGRYERVNPLHSWNANQLITNFFLFQLQRHSDHHAHANRRYQVLRHVEESPQLPYGYATMILIALVPPLWFSLMDKRLETWEINR